MWPWPKKSYPTGATPGQKIAIASPTDARIAQLEKKLAASEARYNDLHARYATLYELNRVQADRVTFLQGELFAATGEMG